MQAPILAQAETQGDADFVSLNLMRAVCFQSEISNLQSAFPERP
jgi:hypothetical protein